MQDYAKIKENAEWYDANREELLSKYRGRYVAISDGRVWGDYGEQVEGIKAMLGSGHEAGTFIVHHCIPREEEVPFICHSGLRCPTPL